MWDDELVVEKSDGRETAKGDGNAGDVWYCIGYDM